MDEKKKKKEYQKKLNSKKLKKSQEYKTLSFTTGISLVFALLFAFFGYSFITGEVHTVPLLLAAAFLAEGLIQVFLLYRLRIQLLKTNTIYQEVYSSQTQGGGDFDKQGGEQYWLRQKKFAAPAPAWAARAPRWKTRASC